MQFSLSRIYPITDTGSSGLSHADQVRQLADAGAELIQIREKRMTSRQLYDEVVQSVAVARPFGVKVIVNDRVDITLTAGADGVHLGQDDLPPEHAREILGQYAIIGYSTHSVEQAIAGVALPVDYIAIGPIFETRTKENPDPVVGLDGLKRVREAIGSFPLVAIGGITGENHREVLAAGADSVALIGDLYVEGSTIGDRYRKLQESTTLV